MNRRRLLLLLGALLVIAATITFRTQRASLPHETAVKDASPRADQPPTSPTAAMASPSSPAASADERPGPKKREGVDAANLYADAFVLFDRLTDEEKAMIRRPREEVDAEKAAQLFEKIQAIMALLRAAAKADYCDWGMGDINFETALPHLGKAQNLASLALWAAAYGFPADPAAALDDLSVRARLGHHLANTLIGMLVSAGLEGSANNLLRDHLHSLNATANGKAMELIAASTLDADIERAMQTEILAAQAMGKKLASQTPEERLSVFSHLVEGDDATAGQSADADRMEAAVRDPKLFAAELTYMLNVEARMADAFLLPEAEFQNWWKGVKDEMSTDHPLAKVTLPHLIGVQETMQKLRIQRALLTAGADVLQNGPAQVGRHRDPATGGALIYVPTPTGFELRSTYQSKGKPVTMTFSRP